MNNPAAGDWYIDLSAFDDLQRRDANTTAVAVNTPQSDLTISKTHTGNLRARSDRRDLYDHRHQFRIGCHGRSRTVVDTLPAGLTATAIERNRMDLRAGYADLHAE